MPNERWLGLTRWTRSGKSSRPDLWATPRAPRLRPGSRRCFGDTTPPQAQTLAKYSERHGAGVDKSRRDPRLTYGWRGPLRGCPATAVAAPGRCAARPACAHAGLGPPRPQAGAAPRRGRAEFAFRGRRRANGASAPAETTPGPAAGPEGPGSQPFAPILPAGRPSRRGGRGGASKTPEVSLGAGSGLVNACPVPFAIFC